VIKNLRQQGKHGIKSLKMMDLKGLIYQKLGILGRLENLKSLVNLLKNKRIEAVHDEVVRVINNSNYGILNFP
jgi:hypothetical protein